MICDQLKNASFYEQTHPRFKKAFEYLQKTDFTKAAEGKYEIDGQNIYAIVQEYMTKLPAEGRWEAHRRYMDIQYVVTGEEFIGYASLDSMEAGEYNEEKDIVFLEGKGSMIPVPAGSFMLLAPQDVHKPQIAIHAPQKVKKVVVKVKM